MKTALPHAPAHDRAARYEALAQEIEAVVAGEWNRVARMATVAAMLADAFDHFSWTGFYLVDPAKPDELVIGPYQGALGCLRIALGRGVCGAAAERQETVIVEDVHAFPGHIACDARSLSEIVVPVFDQDHRLIAVLDVDSMQAAAFDSLDAQGLESIVHSTFALLDGPPQVGAE
jgi:L-methionine (R)-S-oxide reductase